MPLSEREQRILDDLEKGFYQDFPRDTPRPERSAHALGSARRGAAMFAAGLLVLLAFFMTKQVWVGALAFGSMVWGIVVIAGALRSVAPSPRRSASDLGDLIARFAGRLERRLKERYKRR